MLIVMGAGSMVKMAVISHETTIMFGGSSRNEKFVMVYWGIVVGRRYQTYRCKSIQLHLCVNVSVFHIFWWHVQMYGIKPHGLLNKHIYFMLKHTNYLFFSHIL